MQENTKNLFEWNLEILWCFCETGEVYGTICETLMPVNSQLLGGDDNLGCQLSCIIYYL